MGGYREISRNRRKIADRTAHSRHCWGKHNHFQKWTLLVTSSGLAFSRWTSEKQKSLSMLARESGTREMSQAACEKTLRFSTVGKGRGQRCPRVAGA